MSDPTTSATTTAASATASGTQGTTNPSSTTTPDAGGHASTFPPTRVSIQAQTLIFNSNTGWPTNLILDSSKGNWQE